MVTVSEIVSQMFPSKPQWSVDQIPDLTGKVILVTGGNTGIGKETCKQLLVKDAKVYLAARSATKAMPSRISASRPAERRSLFKWIWPTWALSAKLQRGF